MPQFGSETLDLDREGACNALYAAGHHLLNRHRVDDAAVLFRTMLLADSTDERGWLALGACHERLDQDSMAEELYNAGAQIARSRVRCLVAVARLLRKGEHERADEALEIARDLAVTAEEVSLVERESRLGAS
jgi:Tfp pilus assembly protein PilF